MSLLLTFMELDSLYEAYNPQEHRYLLNQIRNTKTGKNYKLDKIKTKQLPKILAYCIKNDERIEAEADIAQQREHIIYCDNCGVRLTDGGYCPICDDGEEDYY